VTDEQLLKNILAGDNNAFRVLYERYKTQVFNTALCFSRDHFIAEELTVEIFAEIHRSIKKFRFKTTLTIWIYKITIVKCIDHIKRERRARRFGYLKALFSRDGELVHHAADFVHPGVDIEHKELSSYLFLATEKLSFSQRTAYILHNMELLPIETISRIMNVSVKGVEVLLQHARLRLNKTLASIYHGEERSLSV
jgi:RNA polymerase sigma factor (sigma-70 family)